MTSFLMVTVALFAKVLLGKLTAGDHAFSDSAHAKTGDWRPAWENSNGNRLSWRFPKKKRGSRQNRRPPWGKSNGKPFILAFTLFSDRTLAKTGDSRGKNRSGTRLSWRSRNKAGSDRRNHSDWGKNNEPPLLLERSTTRSPDFLVCRCRGQKVVWSNENATTGSLRKDDLKRKSRQQLQSQPLTGFVFAENRGGGI